MTHAKHLLFINVIQQTSCCPVCTAESRSCGLFKVLGSMVDHSIAQEWVGFPYLSPTCYWYMKRQWSIFPSKPSVNLHCNPPLCQHHNTLTMLPVLIDITDMHCSYRIPRFFLNWPMRIEIYHKLFIGSFTEEAHPSRILALRAAFKKLTTRHANIIRKLIEEEYVCLLLIVPGSQYYQKTCNLGKFSVMYIDVALIGVLTVDV